MVDVTWRVYMIVIDLLRDVYDIDADTVVVHLGRTDFIPYYALDIFLHQ